MNALNDFADIVRPTAPVLITVNLNKTDIQIIHRALTDKITAASDELLSKGSDTRESDQMLISRKIKAHRAARMRFHALVPELMEDERPLEDILPSDSDESEIIACAREVKDFMGECIEGQLRFVDGNKFRSCFADLSDALSRLPKGKRRNK